MLPYPPTSTDGVIGVRTGHSITVNVNITADQVTVETSATLTKDAHMTLNDGPGDDLRITGTMYDNSGVTSGTGNMVVAVGGILNFSVRHAFARPVESCYSSCGPSPAPHIIFVMRQVSANRQAHYILWL